MIGACQTGLTSAYDDYLDLTPVVHTSTNRDGVVDLPTTIMINTDVMVDGQEPSTLLARAIIAVATPGNVYDGSVVTRP